MKTRLVLALALALALPAAAGCIEAPDFLKSSSSEVSAQANLGVADAAAAEWDPAAKLAGVGAIETAESPGEADMDGDGTSRDDIPQDPDVGNGLARVWWYAYAVDSEEGPQVRVWRVASDGTLERQDDHGFGAELGASGLPVGAWETDSDAAIGLAKSNGTFLNSIAGENATVVHFLGNEEGATLWHVVGVSRSGVAVALVDAKSGELVDVHTIDMGGFAMPDTEGFAPYVAAESMRPYVDISQEGSLSDDESVEIPFTVPDDAVGMIHLAAQGRAPMDGVHYVIYDEEGEAVASGGTYGGFWGDREIADELELDAGAYTLVLESSGTMPMGPLSFSDTEFAVRLFLGPPGLEMHDDEEG